MQICNKDLAVAKYTPSFHVNDHECQSCILLETKKRKMGVPWWLRGLRIQRCYCCGLSYCTAVVQGQFLAWELINRQEYVLHVTCPKGWIGFGNKCFYFSEDSKNWTVSQMFCVSLEANLARFETEEELNFLKRYKGPSDHWIGLSRESPYHVWKWMDNTEYNASFVIRGVGECAYLNDIGVSSARIYTDRNWICSKPNNYVSMYPNTSRHF
uniref:C-type lectin domain-containing protein n=1 Tax=Catagonus wagneri TaxID=51154 RepID=A0A8C3W3Y0_9CETA